VLHSRAMANSTDPLQTLIYGATAIVVGYAAYQIYMSMSATTPASSNTTTSSQSYSGPSSTKATPTPKKPEYMPKGGM